MDNDELIAKLKARIEELNRGMNEAANAAAAQAALPYRAAIGEIENTLRLLMPNPPPAE